MRFCLSSNQNKEYLTKADEIKLPYKDRDIIIDYIHDYPNKTYVIDCFNINDINWSEIANKYNKLTKNIILCVKTIEDLRTAQSLNIKAYFGFPIESFYELNNLLNYDPAYILLGPELFFNLPAVKKFEVKVRAIPNLAYNDSYSTNDGVCGQWIRPEDLESVYGEYIDIVEFADCNVEKEQALYRVYAEDKEWRTKLSFIITNLESDAANRMLNSSVSRSRTECEHKCQKGSNCRICYRALYLASPELIREYKSVLEKHS